jgi:hypothetical protein
MPDDTEKTDLFTRFMELVGRARQLKDRSDPAVVADASALAGETLDLMPQELLGMSQQFKQATAHAHRLVELLANTTPDVQQTKDELGRAEGRVAAGISNTILPALTGSSKLSRDGFLEIMQAAEQVQQKLKDLKGKLSTEKLDLSAVREGAAALCAAMEDLAGRADKSA